ncbi:hypothetical protein [Bacteroidetes bacterium endosymbiont of Geopemphigus sp.]|nr:hypothetical protein [Bacteroidetes bacterium endosymbiont of Geopemphigus sp.]
MRNILLSRALTVLFLSYDDNYESQKIKPSESAQFELDKYGKTQLH